MKIAIMKSHATIKKPIIYELKEKK
jgi:hypothetical protein